MCSRRLTQGVVQSSNLGRHLGVTCFCHMYVCVYVHVYVYEYVYVYVYVRLRARAFVYVCVHAFFLYVPQHSHAREKECARIDEIWDSTACRESQLGGLWTSLPLVRDEISSGT